MRDVLDSLVSRLLSLTHFHVITAKTDPSHFFIVIIVVSIRNTTCSSTAHYTLHVTSHNNNCATSGGDPRQAGTRNESLDRDECHKTLKTYK